MVDLLSKPLDLGARLDDPRQVLTARRLGFIALAVVVLALVAYLMWPSRSTSTDAAGGGGRGGGQTVSVVTADARTADLPIRLRSIGWVQPVATVAITTRLNTEIVEQHVVEGQTVAKGDLLFRLDDREVRAAIARDEATLARDQAIAARTEADRKRGEELVGKGFLTQQTQDQRISDAKSAVATVAADRANLAADNVQLTYTEIHAPIAGRAGAVSVTPGNLVRTTDTAPLITVTQMKPVWVSFSLPERNLTALRAAMAQTQQGGPAPVAQASLSGEGKVRATGQVTFLDNAVDQTTGTIAVKATMPNDDLALWPGQYVDVEIVVGVRAKAVVVPTVALQSGQDGPFVYAVGADSKVQVRQVQVAGTDGDLTAVASGLKPGERVVVEGQQRLTDGMKVRIGAPKDRTKNPSDSEGKSRTTRSAKATP